MRVMFPMSYNTSYNTIEVQVINLDETVPRRCPYGLFWLVRLYVLMHEH